MKRSSVLAILGAALVACAGERRPPVPPPFFGQPPGPSAKLGASLAPAPASAASDAPSSSASAAPLADASADASADAAALPSAAPPAAAPPHVSITIEPPFRLDQRVIPADKATFLADLKERTRWNHGGMGELAEALPPVPGHPLPKVIVDVTHVLGPHSAADVQRTLRKMLWIKVVECYAESAYKDQKLRGKVTLGLRLGRQGRVSAPRVQGSTLNDVDVPLCIADRIHRVELPPARAPSQVTVEIQVGPGDEPIPPPSRQIVPGDGTLPPETIRAVVLAALPAFAACYEPALGYAPELWGRLGLRFHLTDRGKLDEAFEAESRFPDERVTLCILRAARGLQFPKPAGGDVRFIVPLRLWSDRSPVAGVEKD